MAGQDHVSLRSAACSSVTPASGRLPRFLQRDRLAQIIGAHAGAALHAEFLVARCLERVTLERVPA
jgi:hypothetical protein